jgi:glycosyltransferase involved in cell wall biosynthesis
MSLNPSILHLVTDNNIGGVRATLEVLFNSRLGQEFNFSAIFTRTIRQILTRNFPKPDLIVFHTACSWTTLLKLLYLRMFSKVAICEHHYNDSFEVTAPFLSRFHLILWLSYTIANRVVAVSQAQANWMHKYRLVNPNKLKVITPAKVLDRMLEIPEVPDSKVSGNDTSLPSLSVGAYGRFSSEKGFDVLIEAMHLVPTLSPNLTVKLYLGGYGDEEKHLKSLARGSDKIEFVGFVEDAARFLQKCDVVAIPSRRESWGIVCMEAKAAARPVIASAVGGLVEQILAGKVPNLDADYGVIVPPDNPEALAQAIANIGSLSKAKLREWGKRSRESVRNSLEIHISMWEDLFLELI